MTVSLIVAIAFFMQGLDTTAVNTAIPSMAESFSTSIIHLSAGITSYLISLAVFIPVSGWIADRFGTRRVFCSAVILFVIASILCGMSETLTHFVICRVIQGMGGAMMTPVGRLAVLKASTKDNLVVAMAYITWPALIAPILGPMIGGYLSTYFTWHWIFFLNVPIGILCVILAWKHIEEEKNRNEKKVKTPFDSIGFILSGLAFAGIMGGIELFSYKSIPTYIPITVVVFSVCLLLFNVRYSRHISNPLIDYSVMRIPTYKVTIFAGSVSRMVIGVAPYLIPLMFQEGFGLNPFHSGMLFLATMAGNLTMKPVTIWVMRHYNFRSVLIVNGLLVALFSYFTALLLPQTSVFIIVLVMFFSGMFRSMQFSAISTLAFADLPQSKITPANTLYSTIQQMSTGMGIAIGGVFLRLSHSIHGNTGHYTVADFHLAFIFVAILGAVSVLGFTRLSSEAGDDVRGLNRTNK